MNPILRNILAAVAGILVGSFVNGGILNLSDGVIPLPEGVNPNDLESIKAHIHLYGPQNFIFPFLAHALGTLAGALVAALLAANNNMKLALGIGAFFLLGGITLVFLLPGPIWFAVVDLLGAYIPMGWLGGKLAERFGKKE